MSKIQIPSDVVTSEKLSLRARGLFVLMFTVPKEFDITSKWVESVSTEGREAVRSAFSELTKAGLVSRKVKNSGNGFRSRWEIVK